MDAEAEKHRNEYEHNKFSRLLLMQLAFRSLGVVYGDLGTSPLYVFYNTFPDGIEDPEDLIGALSLIIYSLALIPLLKYVLIVCRANDNGQGGTFALYSLLCRHAKVKTIPNQDRADEQLTTYSHSTFHEKSFAAKTKRWLEEHPFRKNALLVLVLVGSSMVIGDGILTPAISGFLPLEPPSVLLSFHQSCSFHRIVMDKNSIYSPTCVYAMKIRAMNYRAWDGPWMREEKFIVSDNKFAPWFE